MLCKSQIPVNWQKGDKIKNLLKLYLVYVFQLTMKTAYSLEIYLSLDILIFIYSMYFPFL